MEEGENGGWGTAAGSAEMGKMVHEGCGWIFRERPLLGAEPRMEGVRSRYPDNCLVFHSLCRKGDTVLNKNPPQANWPAWEKENRILTQCAEAIRMGVIAGCRRRPGSAFTDTHGWSAEWGEEAVVWWVEASTVVSCIHPTFWCLWSE